MATVRSFLACEVSGGVVAATRQVIQRLANVAGPTVRWVDSTHMHITMKFFGDIAPERTSDICRRAQQVLSEVEPFDIEVVGVGAFPSADRPRTIWAGVRGGDERMVELSARLDQALEPLGFPRERRRFKPHLTLGRVKGRGSLEPLASRLQEFHADHELGVTTVDELLLLSSELRPSGPVYGLMATLPMGG